MKYIFIIIFTLTFRIDIYSQTGLNIDTVKCKTIEHDKTIKESDSSLISSNLSGGQICSTIIKKGYNKIYYETGTIEYEGFYSKIKKWKYIKSGYFIYYYKNGNKKEEGAYINGKKEGLWKEYSEDGKISSEEIYENDLNNGYAILYYDNGVVRSKGNYVSDKKLERFIIRFLLRPLTRKTGTWKYYNKNGNKIGELEWTRNNNSEMRSKENKLMGFE